MLCRGADRQLNSMQGHMQSPMDGLMGTHNTSCAYQMQQSGKALVSVIHGTCAHESFITAITPRLPINLILFMLSNSLEHSPTTLHTWLKAEAGPQMYTDTEKKLHPNPFDGEQ